MYITAKTTNTTLRSLSQVAICLSLTAEIEINFSSLNLIGSGINSKATVSVADAVITKIQTSTTVLEAQKSRQPN